jgi:DNA-binding MarR family transcriptional regulator
MSIQAINAVFKTDLHTSKKMVLLCIADHTNDKGWCWMGVEHIAKKASLTSRWVTATLPELEKEGHLTILRGKGPNGTNMYGINAITKGVV